MATVDGCFLISVFEQSKRKCKLFLCFALFEERRCKPMSMELLACVANIVGVVQGFLAIVLAVLVLWEKMKK